MESNKSRRQFLKNDGWKRWDDLEPDQQRGVPPPSLQKPCPPGAAIIDLDSSQTPFGPTMTLIDAIGRRRSVREYASDPLTLPELSFLLWATQGVHDAAEDGSYTLRTVPSAGARHPFETYLVVKHVSGLEPGLYRYLALEHKLCFLFTVDELLFRAADDEWLLLGEAVLFAWTAVPYRTEWRYDILSHKMIAIEAGHVCQNLYLAGMAVGVGTCAIGAYDQDEIDRMLGVDGENEFAIYVATIGKIM